jgi:hypothetical protein
VAEVEVEEDEIYLPSSQGLRAGTHPDNLNALVFVGERGGVLRRTFLARVLKPAATRVGLAVGLRAGLELSRPPPRRDLAHGRQR